MTTRAKTTPKFKGKTYKFATLKREAQKAAADAPSAPELEPFVLTDVEPPIVITAPDTVERQLIIADCIGRDGSFDFTNTLPLLRAMCGDQFGRVWTLVKDDKDPHTLIRLVQAMVDHFQNQPGGMSDVADAGELPGGSEGSSS